MAYFLVSSTKADENWFNLFPRLGSPDLDRCTFQFVQGR